MTAPAIRRAGAADAPAILALSTALYAHEGLAFDPAAARPALERLLAEPALGFVLVADDPAGGLAGHAVATLGFDLEHGGHDAYLTELYVAAPWRGRGVGRALLDAVERELRAAGARAVHLLVEPDNAPALALYAARGFERIPRHFLTKRLT